jgi:hypothetical protein
MCDCSMVERITCGCGYFAVGGDFSPGDGSDDATKGVIACFIFAKCVFQDSSLEILRVDGAHRRGLYQSWLDRRCRPLSWS